MLKQITGIINDITTEPTGKQAKVYEILIRLSRLGCPQEFTIHVMTIRKSCRKFFFKREIDNKK